MPIDFKYNIKDLTRITRGLDSLHRSAYPVAIRQTLNDLAFEAKKNELKKSAQHNFTVRTPSFFNKFSKVEKATGFNTRTMNAKMGMVGDETANFEQQEVGGSVVHKNIGLMDARVARNLNRKVRRVNYLQKGRTPIDSNRPIKQSGKSNYVANAYAALKQNRLFRHKNFLIKIEKITPKRNGVKIKSKLLYDSKENRKVSLQATRFIEETAIATMHNLPKFFIKNAERQFKKYLK